MRDMTATHLRSAFGGESMAHMRYVLWARKACEEGFPNVARLFQAIAFAEQVHANNHFQVHRDIAGDFSVGAGAAFGYGSTSQNLDGAVAGEDFEIREMYPVYLEAAKYQGEKQAQLSFHYALSAEKIHLAMYQAAKEKVDAGSDITLGAVQVCQICGYTHEGDAPDKCPVCANGPEKFSTFA